jgi:death on curing protein
MTEPLWLTEGQVIDFHGEQLAQFGGPVGLRDPSALGSALGRARNKWTYGETDLAALAAAYAFGLAKNHPFIDGNKRAAFIAMMIFLRLNGVPFKPDAALAAAAILALAAGDVAEEGLTRWIGDNWPPDVARTKT